MGHSDIKTTNDYLKSFSNQKLDDTNQKLLDL